MVYVDIIGVTLGGLLEAMPGEILTTHEWRNQKKDYCNNSWNQSTKD